MKKKNDVIYIDNGDYAMMSGYTINIINAQAQQIFNSAINQQTFSINVSQFGATGTYYLQILDSNSNIVEVRHIVLQ